MAKRTPDPTDATLADAPPAPPATTLASPPPPPADAPPPVVEPPPAPPAPVVDERPPVAAPPVIEPPLDPAPVDPPAAPWRVVAVCRTDVRTVFNGAVVSLVGGEWVTEPERVATLSRDDANFEFIPCESPEHLSFLQERHARYIAELQEMARFLGYVVHPAGTACPPAHR